MVDSTRVGLGGGPIQIPFVWFYQDLIGIKGSKKKDMFEPTPIKFDHSLLVRRDIRKA